MVLDRKKILGFFRKSKNRATVLLKDRKKTNQTINDALGKAVANRGDLEGIWNKLQLLFSISRDYVNGEYTQVPKRTLIAILGGLIYFLSPIDVIPDFVPALGFIDDIYILNLVFRQVMKDLEQYQKWKENQDKIISIDPANG